MIADTIQAASESIGKRRRFVLLDGGRYIACHGYLYGEDAMLLKDKGDAVIACIDYRSIVGISVVRPKGGGLFV